jgi:hypothetical protein
VEKRRVAVLAFERAVNMAQVSTKPPGDQEHDNDRAGHQQQRRPHASTILPRRCPPGRERPVPASSPIQNAGARDRQIGIAAGCAVGEVPVDRAGLGPGAVRSGDHLGVARQVERSSAVVADTFSHALPAGSVVVEIPLLELDAGASPRLGGEEDLDLAERRGRPRP